MPQSRHCGHSGSKPRATTLHSHVHVIEETTWAHKLLKRLHAPVAELLTTTPRSSRRRVQVWLTKSVLFTRYPYTRTTCS